MLRDLYHKIQEEKEENPDLSQDAAGAGHSEVAAPTQPMLAATSSIQDVAGLENTLR